MNVHIFANCITSAKSMSGGDRSFIELSKRWKNSGVDIHVYVPKVGYELCKSNGLNAQYVIIPSPDVRKIGVVLTYIIRIINGCLTASKSKLENRSLCYSSSDFLPDVIPALLMKRNNKGSKWIVCIHLLAPSPFQNFLRWSMKETLFSMFRSVLYRFSQKIAIYLMKSADLILVVNTEMKKYLQMHGIPSKRIKIIDNGVNLKYILRIKSGEKRYDAVFVGRFHRQKGLLDLLKIWGEVHKKHEYVKLAIIGGGTRDWEDKLKNEITKRKLGCNIELLGFLSEAKKFKIIKSSKMLLFPSYYESWGIVACEAMACGVPVVAYDLPIYREIFPRGILTMPVGDTEKFADSVISLLNDEARRKRLGEDALKMVSRYDWDIVAERLLDHLKTL